MDKAFLELGVREGKIFKIGKGFHFAVQVPDDTVGCSGSRCSWCNTRTAYCHQICRHCYLPFVGPFGFPQLPEWETLTPEERRREVEEIYCHDSRRGRLIYTNVDFVPLTPKELDEIERLGHRDAHYFLITHEHDTKKIRGILMT